MAGMVKFTATKLASKGKQGILEPDEDGYYTLVIGGLNVYNSAGEFYTLNGAKDLFEESNIFMRRVKNGCLKSEVGHPKRVPGMTDSQYMTRILTIEETNVCAHIKEVWLDFDFGKNNPEYGSPELVAIMGKVKPAGTQGEALKKALENKSENVCFSIRSLTKDYEQNRQRYRVLFTIVAFDWVIEPGIAFANKWDAPGLESTDLGFVTSSNFVKEARKVMNCPVGMESTKELIVDAIEQLGVSLESTETIVSSNQGKSAGYRKW